MKGKTQVASTASKNATPAPAKTEAKDKDEVALGEKRSGTVEKKDQPIKGTPVKITATRLRGVEEKVERATKILGDAQADLDAMLVGKDPERSPIVAQVVEIKHLLDTTTPAFEDVPGRVSRVIDDVEGML